MMDKMEVGNEIHSEHFSVVAALKGECKKRDRRRKGGMRERKVKTGDWGEEQLRKYKEKMESENVGSSEAVAEMIRKLNDVTYRIREEVRPKGNGEVDRRR